MVTSFAASNKVGWGFVPALFSGQYMIYRIRPSTTIGAHIFVTLQNINSNRGPSFRITTTLFTEAGLACPVTIFVFIFSPHAAIYNLNIIVKRIFYFMIFIITIADI